MLTAQMEILQVLLNDGDYSCFADIIVKINELPNPERKKKKKKLSRYVNWFSARKSSNQCNR